MSSNNSDLDVKLQRIVDTTMEVMMIELRKIISEHQVINDFDQLPLLHPSRQEIFHSQLAESTLAQVAAQLSPFVDNMRPTNQNYLASPALVQEVQIVEQNLADSKHFCNMPDKSQSGHSERSSTAIRVEIDSSNPIASENSNSQQPMDPKIRQIIVCTSPSKSKFHDDYPQVTVATDPVIPEIRKPPLV